MTDHYVDWEKTQYVLGFLFSPDKRRVILIRKSKPAWQAGMLNGIGGKVEYNESIVDAMRREWVEETNCDSPLWQHRVTMIGENDGGWQVWVFSAISPSHEWFEQIPRGFELPQEEPVVAVSRDYFASNIIDAIPNLRWLVPLCADEHLNPAITYRPVIVREIRKDRA